MVIKKLIIKSKKEDEEKEYEQYLNYKSEWIVSTCEYNTENTRELNRYDQKFTYFIYEELDGEQTLLRNAK